MLHADPSRSILARARSARPSSARSIADIAYAYGLVLRSQSNGRQYSICPQCSENRSAAGRRLRCLSILIDNDGLRWRCHHCTWHGGAFFDALRRTDRTKCPRLPRHRKRTIGIDGKGRLELARGIWIRAMDAAGSPAEIYLRSRGLVWPLAPWARFHGACPRGRGEVSLPALVASVTVPTSGEFRAVHRIYLRSDGTGKADLPRNQQKHSLGPTSGAAVVLGALETTSGSILEGEGIETTLSACMALDRPGIATLSATTLGSAPLPIGRAVVILADRGGEASAEKGGQIRLAEGRRVWIATPPERAKDFNDLLRDRGIDAVRTALIAARQFRGRA